MCDLQIIILAGGLGKRMKSNIPKVLHKIRGEAMIIRLIKQIIQLNPKKIIIVVGNTGPQIKSEIEEVILDGRIIYVYQETPLGTGHAIKCALPYIDLSDNFLILNGDVPLLQFSTLFDIYDSFLKLESELMITGIHLADPTGNGRILLHKNIIDKIIEEKDCDSQEKEINLVNCGIYVAKGNILHQCIPLINNNNNQKEFYITDLVKIYKNNTLSSKLDLHVLPSHKEYEIYNVNTSKQLNFINSN